jgi:hypothetical protein
MKQKSKKLSNWDVMRFEIKNMTQKPRLLIY